jgi:hypothetical protein
LHSFFRPAIICNVINIIFYARAQIQENADTTNITAETKVSKETHIEIPLEENLNRFDIGSETATNLDEAISVLR